MNCPHGLERINCDACTISELGARLRAAENELAEAKARNIVLLGYNNEQVERRRAAEWAVMAMKKRIEALVWLAEVQACYMWFAQGHPLGRITAALEFFQTYSHALLDAGRHYE